jgi:hypothetical protein
LGSAWGFETSLNAGSFFSGIPAFFPSSRRAQSSQIHAGIVVKDAAALAPLFLMVAVPRVLPQPPLHRAFLISSSFSPSMI